MTLFVNGTQIKLLPYAAHDIDVPATGGWKAIGLGSTGQFTNALLLQAVTDGSDTTYIVNTRWDVTSKVGFTFHAPTIPALAQIRLVVIDVRCKPNYGQVFAPVQEIVDFAFQSADGFSYSGTCVLVVEQDTIGQPPPQDFYVTLPGLPVDGAWTPDVFEGIALTIFGPTDAPAPGGRLVLIEELSLIFVVNEAPTVTVSTDSNPETTTQRPTMSVVYSDPEGDAQERLEYRFYAQPVGGWGGFDPDTTALSPTLSDVVFTSASSYRIPNPLPNNTYRLYVRAADVGSGGRFSAWAYCDLIVAVPPPTRPTIVVQGDAAHCQIVGKVTIVGPTLPPFGAIVQRKNDDGSWSTVMECGALQPTGGSVGNGWTWTVPFRDRTAPRDEVLTYQAITVGADNDNFSQASPAAQVILPDDGKTWLILGTSDASMDQPCAQLGGAEGFVTLSDEDQFAFAPEGRSNYVVVSGTVHGEYQTSGTGLQLGFANDAAWKLFETMRSKRRPVLIKSRFGDSGFWQMWVRFGKTRTLKPAGAGVGRGGRALGGGQQWIVQLPFYEVDQPNI